MQEISDDRARSDEAREAASRRLERPGDSDPSRTDSHRNKTGGSEQSTGDDAVSKTGRQDNAAQQAAETQSSDSANAERSDDVNDTGDGSKALDGSSSRDGSKTGQSGEADEDGSTADNHAAAATTTVIDVLKADADTVAEDESEKAERPALRTFGGSGSGTANGKVGDGASEGAEKASLAAAVGAVDKDASEDADTKNTGTASEGRRAANAAAGNGETDSALEQDRTGERLAVMERTRAERDAANENADDDRSEGRERRGADGAEGSRRVRLDVRDLRTDAARESRAEGKSAEGSGTKIELDGTVSGRRTDGIDGPGRGAGGERPDLSPGRALREQLQPELVRHARLVVRGESSGDIRLTLRPEQLGRVRISLHLEDNRIAGRIIVENGSVRDAFQANVQALERALRDAGLETAGLEVTVGEGDSHDESPQHHGNRRRVAHGFDEMVPQLTGWFDDSSRVSLYA
ncbi:MAG: hypothetical protein EA403_06940 [Spirochaetaceae bacterium]|nr:MAG: hypothetical protein EA403_06940 [Spirochaetaceae bacterium]